MAFDQQRRDEGMGRKTVIRKVLAGALSAAALLLAVAVTPAQAGVSRLPAGCAVGWGTVSGGAFYVRPRGCPVAEAVVNDRIYLGHGVYTNRTCYGGPVRSGGTSTARCTAGYSRVRRWGGIRFKAVNNTYSGVTVLHNG